MGNRRSKKTDASALLEQYHGQFAENYNSSSSHLFSFISAIVTGAGALGVSVIRYIDNQIAINEIMMWVGGTFAIALFVFVSIVSIELGWHVRRDQFVVYLIRKQTRVLGQFHPKYSPMAKGYFSFIPGVFNIFLWAAAIAILFVVAVELIVTIYFNSSICCGCCALSAWLFAFVQLILSLVGIVTAINSAFGKYKRYEEYYSKIITNSK